jgi:hypothetical protein
MLHPLEERMIRFVHPAQHVVQDLRMPLGVVGGR